jgi:predicted RND superfamily exporter protein
VIATMVQPNSPTFDPTVAAAAEAVGLGPDLKVSTSSDLSDLYDAAAGVDPTVFASVVHQSDSGSYDAALWTINTQAGDARAGELNDGLIVAFASVDEAGASAIPTSQNIIGDVVVKSLQSSQVSSLWITLIAATILLIINFWVESRRPFLGVITMLPVALVILATFGTMALTGIPFGPVTATISALAIGIAVPYTIHITHRFQEDRIRFESTGEAIRSTTLHTGGALAGSALTTMAGFGSLVTSNLTPFQQFGAVTFYAIAYALLFSLLVLPSMLVLWDRWHRNRGDATIDEAALHESLGI